MFCYTIKLNKSHDLFNKNKRVMKMYLMLCIYLVAGLFYAFFETREAEIKSKKVYFLAYVLETLTWGFKILSNMIRFLFSCIGSSMYLFLFNNIGKNIMIQSIKISSAKDVDEANLLIDKKREMLNVAIKQYGSTTISVLSFINTIITLLGAIITLIVLLPATVLLIPKKLNK